jgi:hypothetical protein
MFAEGATHTAILAAVDAVERQAPKAKRRATQLSLINDPSPQRGTRLPESWQPSPQGIAYAIERGMEREAIATEAEKFRNYWTAKSGAGATKRDWEATWRNWIITASERRHGRASNQGRRGVPSPSRSQATGADAVLAGMGRLANRIVEKRNAARSGDRQIPGGADTAAIIDLKPGVT